MKVKWIYANSSFYYQSSGELCHVNGTDLSDLDVGTFRAFYCLLRCVATGMQKNTLSARYSSGNFAIGN